MAGAENISNTAIFKQLCLVLGYDNRTGKRLKFALANIVFYCDLLIECYESDTSLRLRTGESIPQGTTSQEAIFT
jgi:hypothetical protein